MKGSRLWIRVLSWKAVLLGIIMVVIGLYNSWSEHALTPHAPFLTLTLSFIQDVYLIRSFTHYKRDMALFSVRGMEYRIKHSNRVTWALFTGVLAFPVTHPSWVIESLHLLFTGLAIVSVYLEMLFYHKKGVAFWSSVIGVVAGSFGFSGGFVFRWYSVALGEVFAAIPAIAHILTTNKKNDE